jgi:hypothetical protein
MLHETLLALMGCTGDVFVDAPPECAPLGASAASTRAVVPKTRLLTRAPAARCAGPALRLTAARSTAMARWTSRASWWPLTWRLRRRSAKR